MPNQVKWTCFRRELYAIQQGIQHFINEINGRHLVVYSDHKAIVGAFRNPDAMPYDPVAKNQLVEISMWTQDIRYLQARSNIVADTLSRPSDVPLGTAYQIPSNDDSLVESPDQKMTQDLLRLHSTNGTEVSALEHGESPQQSTQWKQARNDAPKFELHPATVDVIALNTVDYTKLAADQSECPDVAEHKAGRHAPGLVMKDFEFIPGVHIYCDVANNKKARPLVPKPHRDLIIRWFHDIGHPGP